MSSVIKPCFSCEKEVEQPLYQNEYQDGTMCKECCLKERFASEWGKKRYLFKDGEMKEGKKRSYTKLAELCDILANKENGESVNFEFGEMTVISKNERFIICFDGNKYAVIDLMAGLMGPTDRVFQLTDFNEVESVNELLEALGKGECELSYRHSCPIDWNLKQV